MGPYRDLYCAYLSITPRTVPYTINLLYLNYVFKTDTMTCVAYIVKVCSKVGVIRSMICSAQLCSCLFCFEPDPCGRGREPTLP
jgi:hypothetical protein